MFNLLRTALECKLLVEHNVDPTDDPAQSSSVALYRPRVDDLQLPPESPAVLHRANQVLVMLLSGASGRVRAKTSPPPLCGQRLSYK